MKYTIDQSGKVESTQKLTVVSCANGKVKTLLISAVEKRKLLITMRFISYPKQTFFFRVFAGLVFMLVKDEKIDYLIIDREYPGRGAMIRDIIPTLFKKNNKKPPEIVFKEIGKKDKAHKAASMVFQGKQKPRP